MGWQSQPISEEEREERKRIQINHFLEREKPIMDEIINQRLELYNLINESDENFKKVLIYSLCRDDLSKILEVIKENYNLNSIITNEFTYTLEENFQPILK